MQKVATETRVSLQNILYSTDFSNQSHAALPYALSIARKYGSKVFAANIIPMMPFPPSSPPEAWEQISAQATQAAEEAMRGLEPQMTGVRHELIVRRGDIWAELSSIIEQNDIDLVVIGTHGRTGVSKLLLGSVAEKIFRQAPCPVLTVGPNVCGEPDSIVDLYTILYPTDFSAESLAAAPYALSLAQENQSRLYLLHVTDGPVDGATEASLTRELRTLIPPEAELWCEPKTFVEAGAPAEKILGLAEELGVDLIVVGVKHAGKFPGVSTHGPAATAYNVVTHAICPVLTVRTV